jgi:hypothetical protein
MLVFSVSLIRLVYDMIHKDANPVLQIASAWMVLSVGLIDAIVYVSSSLVSNVIADKLGCSRIHGQAKSTTQDGRSIIIPVVISLRIFGCIMSFHAISEE